MLLHVNTELGVPGGGSVLGDGGSPPPPRVRKPMGLGKAWGDQALQPAFPHLLGIYYVLAVSRICKAYK